MGKPQPALPDALVAELRAQLADMRRTIEDVLQDRDRAITDLQRERDEWREVVKRLTLPAPNTMRAEATPPTTPQGGGDAGVISRANEPVRDAAVPKIAAGAAQGRLLRTWRWLRSTG